jgi:hypothetical protein
LFFWNVKNVSKTGSIKTFASKGFRRTGLIYIVRILRQNSAVMKKVLLRTFCFVSLLAVLLSALSTNAGTGNNHFRFAGLDKKAANDATSTSVRTNPLQKFNNKRAAGKTGAVGVFSHETIVFGGAAATLDFHEIPGNATNITIKAKRVEPVVAMLILDQPTGVAKGQFFPVLMVPLSRGKRSIRLPDRKVSTPITTAAAAAAAALCILKLTEKKFY